MSCWMSSGNDDPAIVYILQYCVLQHTWLLQYVFLVTRAFLSPAGKNGEHNLLLYNKYCVAAEIYALWISYVSE